MQRVIGGILRHRKLINTDETLIRATKDLVKGSIFNTLQFRLTDAAFLDLFAGTGAIGIEAYSRGATDVTLVDSHALALKAISTNLTSLGIGEQVSATQSSVNTFLTHTPKTYDFIFIDPPYQKTDLLNSALVLINDRHLLKQGGEVIAEVGIATKAEDLAYGPLVIKKIRPFGQTKIIFFAQNI